LPEVLQKLLVFAFDKVDPLGEFAANGVIKDY